MKTRATEDERMTSEERLRYEGLSAVFKALSHPTRLFILNKLKQQPYCVCDLTGLVGADTSTVSKHLSILKASGFVTDRKQGTSVFYRLSCGCVDKLIESAETVVQVNLERIRQVLDRRAG